MIFKILFTLITTPLLFITATLLWTAFHNRKVRNIKLFIGGTIADTFALYKKWWHIIILQVKYLMVWLWLNYLQKTSTWSWRMDFIFNFPNTNGSYCITHARQYYLIDGSSDNTNNINNTNNTIYNIYNLIRIFFVLFPHTIVSYRQFLRECANKRIIDTPITGNVLDIEYMTNDGTYSVKFDLENEINITANDDLLFGEFIIDPNLSKRIFNN